MKHLAPRYGFFVLGVAINSFGVAFITKSALGTSQISSVPYVLSRSGLSVPPRSLALDRHGARRVHHGRQRDLYLL